MTLPGYGETDCDLDHARRIASTRSAAPVSRPHRSFDWLPATRYQSSSPARNRFFQPVIAPGRQRVLLRRGLECGAALAHDLPGRQFALPAPGFADIRQIACASSSRGISTSRSALLIG